jgi:hypothetical protein
MMTTIDCWCYECRKDIPVSEAEDFARRFGGIVLTEGMCRMFLCPDCGNKRCPRATDHREACSGSNEPGQAGSRYGGGPGPNRRLFDFAEGRDPGVDT